MVVWFLPIPKLVKVWRFLLIHAWRQIHIQLTNTFTDTAYWYSTNYDQTEIVQDLANLLVKITLRNIVETRIIETWLLLISLMWLKISAFVQLGFGLSWTLKCNSSTTKNYFYNPSTPPTHHHPPPKTWFKVWSIFEKLLFIAESINWVWIITKLNPPILAKSRLILTLWVAGLTNIRLTTDYKVSGHF